MQWFVNLCFSLLYCNIKCIYAASFSFFLFFIWGKKWIPSACITIGLWHLKGWEWGSWFWRRLWLGHPWQRWFCGYCFISAVHGTEAVRVHHVDTALFLQSMEPSAFIRWILLYFCSPLNWESSSCGYCFISAVRETKWVHLKTIAAFSSKPSHG